MNASPRSRLTPWLVQVALTVGVISLTGTVPAHALGFPGGITFPKSPYFYSFPLGEISAYEGESRRFSVGASGDPQPTFQWRRNGTNLPGATDHVYVISSVRPSDAGTYSVVATNRHGSTSHVYATLTVLPSSPPTVARQPGSQTVTQGDVVALSVAAEGAPAPTYQWRKDGDDIPGATRAVLTIGNARLVDSGTYQVQLRNVRGTVLSDPAILDVRPPTTRILDHPASATVAAGGGVTFTVAAAGTDLTYQWTKDGVPIPGATRTSYAIGAVTATDAGFYSAVVSGGNGTAASDAAILMLSSGGSSRLLNLSARGRISAASALAAGFSWRGPGAKRVLLRGIGPTLGGYGVDGILPDPTLELHQIGTSGAVLANDDWSSTPDATGVAAATAAIGTFPLASGSRDAAILALLPDSAPRNYTAIVTSGDANAEGIVLAEVYDADATASSRLTALSVLGHTSPGAAALIPGFTIGGMAPKAILIRAIGPGLERFGIAGALADPVLAVLAAGLPVPVGRNDNWDTAANVVAASARVGAFPLDSGSKDAALVITLPPGAYTVAISGAGSSSGSVLVEVYDLDR